MNYRSALARIVFLSFLATSASNANSSQLYSSFEVRKGDLNSDGRVDLLIREKPKLITIVDDFPVFSKRHFSDFVLQQTQDQAFTAVTSLTSAQRALMQSWASATDVDVEPFDVNMDGIIDLLIRRITDEISGANNVIAFGLSQNGAASVQIRNYDDDLKEFITHTLERSEDPDMFDPVPVGSCYSYSYSYSYWDTWQDRYFTDTRPGIICRYTYQTPDYHDAAVQFWEKFDPIFDGGQAQPGSDELIEISDILTEKFGIEFFRGALTNSDPEGFDFDDFPPCTDPDALERARCEGRLALARVMTVLVEIGVGAIGEASACPTSGSHYWETTTTICTQGQGFCTVDNVYKDQLTHPAPLESYFRNTPIRDGEKGHTIGQPIEWSVDKPNKSHINITMPGHNFHPGQVERQTITQASGGSTLVKIHSVGTGNGKCKEMNEFAGPILFEHVNLFIKAHIVNGAVNWHSPIP